MKEKLNNLTVLVDWNDIQISGRIEEIMPVNIPELWKSRRMACHRMRRTLIPSDI